MVSELHRPGKNSIYLYIYSFYLSCITVNLFFGVFKRKSFNKKF